VNTEIPEENVKSRQTAAFYLKISWNTLTSSLNMSFTKAMNIAPKNPTARRASINKAIRPRKLKTITPQIVVSKIISEKSPVK